MARVELGRDERGQLLLVGAIGLGVLFVLLALVLNAAIFADTLAPHDDTLRDAREVQHVESAVERGVAGLVVTVNANDATSHEALVANLSAGVADWDGLNAGQAARSGAMTNVSLVGVTNGTRIGQDVDAENGTVRRFTNESGAANWTAASSVSGTRDVRLNVTQPESMAGDGTCDRRSECYALEVENGSANETWRLSVYAADSGNVTVWVENASGGVGSCTAPRERAWINVTAGTLAGTECPHLSFAEGVTAPYTVTHHNGDAIAGTYTLTVDTEVASTPHYTGNESESPSLTPAIYSSTVEFSYRSADLRYTTQLRVTPGERDA